MEHFDILTEEAFDIIYHTYRMKVIDAFGSRDHMTATFKQIADQLGDNSSKVSYHGRMFIKIGLLTLDHTEVINGITAKHYKLLSDNFRVKFDKKNDPVIRKKIQKGQASLVLDGLHQMENMVTDMNHDNRSLSYVMNDLHLTKEDMKELWHTMEKFNAKKEKRDDTTKVTLYTLLVNNHDQDCC